MASGALVGLGLVLGLGGAAAVGYAVTRPAAGGMTPAGSAAMGAAIAQLDGDLKSAQAQVEGKAKTLAEISELRSSIGTDAATTMERIGKEIAFKPDTNEVLELAQAPKEGAPQTLVVLPATTDLASLTHAGKPGSYVELADGKAVITTSRCRRSRQACRWRSSGPARVAQAWA
ncbi:MAG: hypothetical protein NT062_01715 [Proteobacteria bacterium]|nr:hypothetical protein [Pseudomonadota bacterium]